MPATLNPASPVSGAGRAVRALRKALRAVSAGLPRASHAIIGPARPARAGLRAPAPCAEPPRKASRRAAAERADRDDCLICRACVSF